MQPTLQLRAASGDVIALTALRLHRSLAWPVGVAEAELSPVATPPSPEEEVRLEAAGDAGQPAKRVMTGRVLEVERTLQGVRVRIEETTGLLTRLRMDKQHKNTTAGVVIRDLCSQAGVSVGKVEPGATLPAITLVQERSAMEYVLHLCCLSGLMAHTTADGKLNAVMALPAPGGTTIQAPATVLKQWAVKRAAFDQSTTVSGEGAYGKQGAGAEHWLLQDPTGMVTGEGSLRIHFPELKSAGDVAKAQKAEAAVRQEQAKPLRLRLAGPPPGDPGEVVMVNGFGGPDGPCRIADVELIWSASAGLVTTVLLTAVA